MIEKPPPVLQALVLADHIYTDTFGKRIICGTFSQMWMQRFPSLFSRSTWAFILLADVVGEVSLQLRFMSLDENRMLMESAVVKVKAKSPLTPVDLALEVPNFPLPRAGVYSLECYADKTLIGSVRLQVFQLGAPETES